MPLISKDYQRKDSQGENHQDEFDFLAHCCICKHLARLEEQSVLVRAVPQHTGCYTVLFSGLEKTYYPEQMMIF